MSASTAPVIDRKTLEPLFEAGAHFGYSRSRRHPSSSTFIFGAKNRSEIFDLEKTHEALTKALEFVKSVTASNKSVLFVCGKSEGKEALRQATISANMPYVAGRFIGGTLTNFSEIKKRVEKLEKLMAERESGALNKYTKKERLLIDREIDRLTRNFEGIVSMKNFPGAVFIIDPKREHIVVAEARKMKIPVIALANSDCDLSEIDFAIPGNDSLKSSIEYFVNQISHAAFLGKGVVPAPVVV